MIIIMLIESRKKPLFTLLELSGSSFEQTWIPFHLRMLCAKFGWNWPSGSGEEDENMKSLQQNTTTTTTTDNGQIVIRKAQVS